MMKRPVLLTGLLVLGVVGLAAARQVGWILLGSAVTGADGKATLTTDWFKDKPTGIYRYKAEYEGDADYAPSSSEGTVTIVSVWIGNRIGPPGGKVTLSGWLKPPLAGEILKIYESDLYYGGGAVDQNGRVDTTYFIPADALPNTMIPIKAEYNPPNMATPPAISTAAVLVGRWQTGLDMGNRTARPGEWVSVSAYLKRYIQGLPSTMVPGKPLRVLVDGVEQVPVKTTDATGRVAYAYKVPLGQAPGILQMRAEFLGDSMYQPIALSRTLTVMP